MAALDEHPQVVLAHSWSAVIDGAGEVKESIEYPVNMAACRRRTISEHALRRLGRRRGRRYQARYLRRTPLHASYHFADRTFTAEPALHGPFYMVLDRLYFRRQHAGQGGLKNVRNRWPTWTPAAGTA